MDEVEERGLLKSIQRKFPVCNVIDARTYNGKDISDKCNETPSITEVKFGKKVYGITLCTGSFNVYVLNIEERV